MQRTQAMAPSLPYTALKVSLKIGLELLDKLVKLVTRIP